MQKKERKEKWQYFSHETNLSWFSRFLFQFLNQKNFLVEKKRAWGLYYGSSQVKESKSWKEIWQNYNLKNQKFENLTVFTT